MPSAGPSVRRTRWGPVLLGRWGQRRPPRGSPVTGTPSPGQEFSSWLLAQAGGKGVSGGRGGGAGRGGCLLLWGCRRDQLEEFLSWSEARSASVPGAPRCPRDGPLFWGFGLFLGGLHGDTCGPTCTVPAYDFLGESHGPLDLETCRPDLHLSPRPGPALPGLPSVPLLLPLTWLSALLGLCV